MDLPFATLQNPVSGGCIRERADDFRVEEIPAYEFSGRGDHVFFLVEKKGLTTYDAVGRIAQALGRDPGEIGCAGLKDKRAVTRQWMSLEHADDSQVRALDLERIRIAEVTRHSNKLKKGHLLGNRFTIAVSGIESLDRTALDECLAEISSRGVPNYFGPQRLGEGGKNAENGRKIVTGKWRGPSSKKSRKMLVSAYRSELFNRVLAMRIETYDRFMPGDLAFIHGKGAVFPVENPDDVEARRASFEVSPSGPEAGHGGVSPSGEPGEIEKSVLDTEQVQPERWKKLKMKASRRPLRVPAADLSWREVDRGIELSFALPRGSYATSLIREILKK